MPKRRITTRTYALLISVASHWFVPLPATAQPYAPIEPDYATTGQSDVRYGGALAESYEYHRQPGHVAAHTSPSGWYGYGFPVSSYRWGWFGAERYYPRVTWHCGYYGDSIRWAYRHGY